MIVNAIPEGWEVIYQQAHGVLAAELAYYLKPNLQCPHWVATLIAIANHDNRQKTWQGKDGLTPAGAPADFALQPPTLEQAEALMHAVPFQGQWVTLLTSMHMSFLYEKLRSTGQAADIFLNNQQALQQACRRHLHISSREAKKAYAILQWCDRLSLILCRQELPADERALEITAGPDNQTYFIRQSGDGALHVQPWPFSSRQLEVQVEYRVLNQLQFKDDDQLAAALRAAVVKYRKWRFAQV
ncbi:DUF3891 family protein [Pontibacter liquoris]|uniref:DUF3891 family protein n=1 Tax=Pontibacter liquoris TaxID=2905677 RepID=UPI001FA7E155|nr:DUF3891 family protein [Pontibacter liquoris]